MTQTNPPNAGGGGTRGTILLLIAGVVILAIAGIIVYARKPRPEEPPPPPPPPAKADLPAPLVVSQVTRPIVAESDAGLPKTEKAGQKTTGGAPAEKLGTIDPKIVDAFINERFHVLRACYERRLKTNPFLQGVLDLNIGVSSKGKVTSVSTQSDSLRDPEMEQCVKSAIRNWQFPLPEGGRVVIGKSFSFKPKV